MKKRISFAAWIDEVGVHTIADHLKLGTATIYHWRAGRCDPRVDQMRRLKRFAKGRIGYEEMIDRPKATGVVYRHNRKNG